MAATAASEVSDGPVLNLINKRLRSLRKKYNRILQMEESITQGKTINKEQEDVLRSKPSVIAAIDELEKLIPPLSGAVEDEINLAIQRHQVSSADSSIAVENKLENNSIEQISRSETEPEDNPQNGMVEDILNLLYFGSMFDVKAQNDFTATMLTRTHERGCCLTYDYVTDDDATDLLGENDLDLISKLSGLLISRPVDSGLSHKNALHQCIEHAKFWLEKSERPIGPDSSVTYAGLRDKLNKIMSSDYFTTTPEMKAPGEVAAAAAGNYVSFQVPVHADCSTVQYYQKEEDAENFHGNGTYHQYDTVDEVRKDGLEAEITSADAEAEAELIKPQVEVEQNARDVESKEHQYVLRRPYQNQRGSSRGGGRRGYANGRGGRSGGRGNGGYQNGGRNRYYEQSGKYYQGNFYNNRGRGGRGGGHSNGNSYNNNGLAVSAQADS